MPLTSVTLDLSAAWGLYAANSAPFQNAVQSDTENFSLDGISTTTWNQLYAKTWVISPSLSAPAGPAAVAAAGGSLSAGTYYYKITATGGAGVQGETTGSAEVNATTAGGNLTINLSWTASTNASAYNVYRGTAPGAENLLIASPTTNSYSDTGAAAGTAASVPGVNTTGYYEFSFLGFTNLVNETVSLAHGLSLVVFPSGGQAQIAPGTTNGLVWFVDAAGHAVPLPVSGVFAYSLPYTATGQVIDSTHNTLRITVTGATNHTSTVLLIGKTT